MSLLDQADQIEGVGKLTVQDRCFLLASVEFDIDPVFKQLFNSVGYLSLLIKNY
jgi:hypothetical protein